MCVCRGTVYFNYFLYARARTRSYLPSSYFFLHVFVFLSGITIPNIAHTIYIGLHGNQFAKEDVCVCMCVEQVSVSGLVVCVRRASGGIF